MDLSLKFRDHMIFYNLRKYFLILIKLFSIITIENVRVKNKLVCKKNVLLNVNLSFKYEQTSTNWDIHIWEEGFMWESLLQRDSVIFNPLWMHKGLSLETYAVAKFESGSIII